MANKLFNPYNHIFEKAITNLKTCANKTQFFPLIENNLFFLQKRFEKLVINFLKQTLLELLLTLILCKTN